MWEKGYMQVLTLTDWVSVSVREWGEWDFLSRVATKAAQVYLRI